MPGPDLRFELCARDRGFECIAGVDEVGRGPLAGPVVAAAVIFAHDTIPTGLADSKTISAARRADLKQQIYAAGHVGIGQATVAEIDQINILKASHLAMRRAIDALPVRPDYALIDGHLIPAGLSCQAEAIVKGDGRSASIAAASIIAKLWRDEHMVALAQQYPQYGWDKNAGYPTAQHRLALSEQGVTPHHRRSFKPIHNILYQDKNVSD